MHVLQVDMNTRLEHVGHEPRSPRDPRERGVGKVDLLGARLGGLWIYRATTCPVQAQNNVLSNKILVQARPVCKHHHIHNHCSSFAHLTIMDWKKNNKTYQILKAAEDGNYGVVAPIAYVIFPSMDCLR